MEEQQGNPQELIMEVQEGLFKLAQLFGQSNVPEQEKQKLAQVIQGFDSLVKGGEQPQGMDQASPEAGAAQVQQSM